MQHSLAIFSKLHEFVQKRSFQPDVSTFCHLCTGCNTFWRFSAKCTSLSKTAFSARDQQVLSFLHWTHYFLAILSKRTSLYKTAFSARLQHVLSFSYWAHYFLAILSKLHEFVQNSLFSPTPTRFVPSALGAPLFSNFQQSSWVCAKKRFQHEIRTFCHFCIERTIFKRFSPKCTSL